MGRARRTLVEGTRPLVRAMATHRIAVIPGDGIGKEVMPEGIRVLEAVGRKFELSFRWDHFPWSCEQYLAEGRMMPEDGLTRIRNHDAIFLGAVGFPGVPDHVSLWGLLIPIRRAFQQYANVRPVRLMPGVRGDRGRVCSAAEHVHAPGGRPDPEVRLRDGEKPPEEAPHLGHQIERDLRDDALLWKRSSQ